MDTEDVDHNCDLSGSQERNVENFPGPSRKDLPFDCMFSTCAYSFFLNIK